MSSVARRKLHRQLRSSSWLGGWVVSLATLCFVALGLAVYAGATHTLDRQILLSIHATASAWQDALWVVLTHLAGGVAVVLVVLGVAAVLLYKRHKLRALQFAASVGGAMALSTLLKLTFGRVRPELWEQLILETTYSFPSGHAIASSAIALSAVVLLWDTKWRRAVLAAGAVYVVLIGYSRLYLGVHYPTDVLAGWLVSIAWVCVVAVVCARLVRGRTQTQN